MKRVYLIAFGATVLGLSLIRMPRKASHVFTEDPDREDLESAPQPRPLTISEVNNLRAPSIDSGADSPPNEVGEPLGGDLSSDEDKPI